MQDFDYCKSEFKWFLSVQYKDIPDLKDKINEFCHNFCFDDLYDDNKINELFGNDVESQERYIKLKTTTCGYDDGDDSKLARIVYFLIHIDNYTNEYAIPGLKSFYDIGSGCNYKYRGDTINTYGTLFGNNNQGKDKFFVNTKQIQLTQIANFRIKYLTIGNYFLLPATTIQAESINSYRGKCKKYCDFFDLFLDSFINKQDFDKWKNIPETQEYFSKMNNIDNFININFLQDYFDKNNEVIINKFEHPHPENPYHWNYTDISESEEYRKFALNYIKTATEIIDNRADKISELLNDIYKN